jgi:hypothetical protein
MKGGREHNVTAGLNWYLYSNLRLMFNYAYADVDDTGVSPAFVRSRSTVNLGSGLIWSDPCQGSMLRSCVCPCGRSISFLSFESNTSGLGGFFDDESL